MEFLEKISILGVIYGILVERLQSCGKMQTPADADRLLASPQSGSVSLQMQTPVSIATVCAPAAVLVR